MTLSERLNSKLRGFVPDVDGLLIDQGLNPDDGYTAGVGNSGAFQLAYAYGLVGILMLPDLSEGDWSRSWGDRSAIEKIVNSIFSRFAPNDNPLNPTIKNISNRW